MRIEEGKTWVSLNNGTSFEPEREWKQLNETYQTASTSLSANAAYTYNIILAALGLKIPLTIGANFGTTNSYTLTEFRDVDGDGYPDLVWLGDDGLLKVRRSAIARTNKLKTVNNPLGGSFTMDYERSQATYDHPGGKWVLASLETNDGLADDGPNMKTVFKYSEGRQERHEREFLGFGRVETDHIDTEHANAIYRKAIQEYDVNSIYTAGNETRSTMEDAGGKKYVENRNEYYVYEVKPEADNYTFSANSSICSDRAIAFTPVKYTQSKVYEGTATGTIANEIFYDYYLNGNHGELKNYT